MEVPSPGCLYPVTRAISASNLLRPGVYLGSARRSKVTLTRKERDQLTKLTSSGKSTAAKFLHSRASLLCDPGKFGEPGKVADVAMALGVGSRTMEHIAQRFVEEDVEAALVRKPRTSREP